MNKPTEETPDRSDRGSEGRKSEDYDGPTDGYADRSGGCDGPSNGCEPAFSYDGPRAYDGPEGQPAKSRRSE